MSNYASRFSRRLLLPLAALLCSLTPAAPCRAQAPDTRNIHVVMRHNDNGRTGQYLNETALNTSTVNPSNFGLLFSLPVDGELYAQPLYVSNLTIAGGTHDVVFVATAHNSLYAYDATGANPVPYWHINFGPAVPSGVINTPNLPVEVGIISTPAIDMATGTMYVCEKDYFNNVQRFHVHAIDLATGADKINPAPSSSPSGVEITGSINGTGDGNDGQGHVPFRPNQENQRVAVTLANGNVYLTFAGHEDYSPYHGWVISYNAATLVQNGIHCNTPTGGAGGIWMSGEGLAVDAAGSLYYVGGNGTYNGAVGAGGVWDGTSNLGEAVVKLNANSSVADWFTPQNYDYLNSIDFDLSSSGIMIMPRTGYILAGGKEGKIYVLNPNNMGKFHAGADTQIVQEFQASGGHIHSVMTFWNGPDGPTLYSWGESDKFKAFRFVNGFFQTTPAVQSTMNVFPGYANGPGVALSASGSTAGSGVLWVSLPYDGDAIHQHVGGILRAFDAQDLTKELWNSKMTASDDTGIWAKWTPSVIVKGRVYQATFSNKLNVYGVLPSIPPAAPTALAASAGNSLVALSWTKTGRATGYNIKRSTMTGTGYQTIASNVTNSYYVDSGLTNGTTYYYVVSALNAFGESGISNEDSATPSNSIAGTSIGFSFVGGGTAMSAGEIAGVVPVSNWNNAANASGTQGGVLDSTGQPLATTIAYSCSNVWQLGIADTPGDFRLMNGYLDSTDSSITTVTVSGLPGSYLSSGYDVYVYCDSDSTGRAGDYTIGNTTILAQDNSTFNGTYTEAINGPGNYVVFHNLTDAGFTLSVSADTASGGFRAPVNAIQIVAHSAALPAPANLTAAAGNAIVTLNWTAAAGASSYKVKRSTTAGGPYSSIATGVAGTSYVDNTAANGSTYYYVVSAVSAGGGSANSNEASATPLMPDFSLTVNNAAVSLGQGAMGTLIVTAPAIAGLSGSVTLSASGLPSGVTAAFNPVSVFTDRQSVVTLTAADNAAPGTSLVTIKGVQGSLQHTVQFSLTVTMPPAFGNGTYSINFQGGITADGTPMTAGETAGVVPVSGWNNAAGASGSLANLHDSANAATTLSIAWSGGAPTWELGLTDTPGNVRLMNGYLDTYDTTSTTVTVSGLDSTQTYKVYVYADGDGADGRKASYAIGSQKFYLKDTANFSGVFTQVTSTSQNNPGSGNYMVFAVSGQTTMTLTAQPLRSGSTTPRAPLNGIEIVSAGRTISGTITLEQAVNPAQPITFTFRDPNTQAVLFMRTQTLTAIPSSSRGTFSLTGIPSGKYSLAMQGAVNMRKTIALDASAGNVSNIAALLPGGDANGDNKVDLTDFGYLVNSFGGLKSVPGSGYTAATDFNFDSSIDLVDFGILVNNFGSQGDL